MVNPTSIGGAYAAGMITPDYVGSKDEWDDYVIDSLIGNYKTGAGGLPGYGDASIGQPNPADFGTPNKPLSPQTQKYFEDYVKKFGGKDPWIVENFGTPPTKYATYMQDPNSASSIYGTFKEKSAEAEKDRAHEAAMNAADNATRMAGYASSEKIATMQEQGATQRTQMQIDAAWKTAMLEDATRRYIAEGDWGVQKWITTENNAAAMARLQLQLGFEREALAQQAVAERNRHHEQMVGLALEVAKYDEELAASPRNWLKYAGWLQTRNIVVNGMTLAMAAQEVPEQTISPAVAANGTGDNLAGIETFRELTSGQSGGSTSTQNAFGAQTQQMVGAPGAQQNGPGAPPNATMNSMQQPMSPEQLGQVTDYSQFTRDLLGMNPLAPDEGDASQANLQNIANSLDMGAGSQRRASFGAYSGPTTNALGVEIPQVSGKDVDYRKFSRALPTEQEMTVGGVESVRGSSGVNDWLAEMHRARPKGGGSALAWG